MLAGSAKAAFLGYAMLVLALMPVPALSDLIIELKDGKTIVVPIDPRQIQGITFSDADTAGSLTVKPAEQSSRQGRVWQVGPKRTLKYPGQVARRARDGDIVEIDAGVYPNDYAIWKQDNITLRGVGGMAHLKSTGLIPNGKAIWVINGDNVRIENIEFSGAAVKDTNGAGIRHQGGRLRLNNTFFHDNEFSILSGKLPSADIEIRSSRFWRQKRRKRHSHGIYIGEARSLTLIGNHFKGTDGGHQIKSRALRNLIAYNRVEDLEGGNSSRLIDLSNCGFSIVLGNQLHQGPTTSNFNAIGYGPEGCKRRTEHQMQLYVVNNTFINEAASSEFVRNFAGGDVLVSNNLLFGTGRNLSGTGIEGNNVRLPLANVPGDRWSAISDPDVLDRARNLSDVQDGSLVPDRVFDAPVGTRARLRHGHLDVGADEFQPAKR